MDENENPEMQVDAVDPVDRLLGFIASDNLAADMQEIETDDTRNLGRIASDCIRGYKIDLESRKDWLERNHKAIELAMLVSEDKNYPFEGASNVKFPLLTESALQFNARCYPAIVQGNRVAKCKAWGEDQQGAKAARADRVSEHLSYQLLAEMPEWEEDTDRLTVMLPLTGSMFRKVWFDPSLGRNTSRLLPPDRVVVNYFAQSVYTAPRLTEELELYPYEIQERINSGRFVKFDYRGMQSSDDESKFNADDDQAPHLFLEQHTRLDLDQDGYPEPYIVTIHKATEKVVRIVANYDADSVSVNTETGKISAIRGTQYFIQYVFYPSMDGGCYGMGVGSLLADTTETINTTLNQMLDAGHLSNIQGGLVSAAAGIREKSIRLGMGEWRTLKTNVPLNQAVFPIKYDGPSPVLFQLLGFMVENGKSISSIKDILTGESRPNMTASATLALIEQGMQVFTAIFKRIHRSLKMELGAYAKLNREFLDPERYNALFDGDQPFDPAADYSEADMDIMPVSDPNVSTKMQELAKANFLREIAAGNPTLDPVQITRRVLEAAQVEDIEKLFAQPPEPDPVTQQMMIRNAMLELDDKEADIVKKMAGAMKDLASADAEDNAASLQRSALMLKALEAEINAENGQGRLPPMEGQPANTMGDVQTPPAGGQDGQGNQGNAYPVNGSGGEGMGEPASAGGL